MKFQASLANAGAAQRVLAGQLKLAARVKMAETGREMVSIANQKMSSQFDLDRPGSRRRYEGSTRAAKALDYQLDGSTDAVRFRVKGGDNVLKRIIFMNFGTRPHDIDPNGSHGGNGVILGWEDGEGWVVARHVDHPGQTGRHFLEEARDEAVAKIARQ